MERAFRKDGTAKKKKRSTVKKIVGLSRRDTRAEWTAGSGLSEGSGR